MNKQSISVLIALLMGTAGIVMTIMAMMTSNALFEYIGIGAAAMGFMASVPPMMKLNRTQIFAHEFAALALAFGIFMAFEQSNILLALVPVFAIFGTMAIRLQLYPTLDRTTAIWLEPVMVMMMIALYVAGNLIDDNHGTWQGWVYAAVPLMLGTMITMMTLMDRTANLKAAKGGFAADVGEPAPDFELEDEGGETVKLSDFEGKNHVLIIFYRGDWCPFCNIMLRLYKKEAHRFQGKDIVMLAIGPDDPQTNRDLVKALGLPFHVLSDPDLSVVKEYGIKVDKYNPGKTGKEGETDSPLPASFLIDKTGTVQFTSHPARVGEFLRPELIFPVLDQLDRQTAAA